MVSIQEFLNDLELINTDQSQIVHNIRNKVKTINPLIHEKIKYGGIMFYVETHDLGGIFVRKNHVSVEFTSGYAMNDPKGILEGTGKLRRHIKIKKIQDIEEYNLPFYLAQMLGMSG